MEQVVVDYLGSEDEEGFPAMCMEKGCSVSKLPLYGTVTILLYASDVPGKLPDEQEECKEWEFQEIKSRLKEFLLSGGMPALPENWEWGIS